MFFRTRDKSRDRPAAHVEIWDDLRRRARFDRVVTIAALLLCIVGTAHAAYNHHIALTRPVVYYVDSEGRAVHGGQLSGTSVAKDVEARYVAKRFLRSTIALNSLTVEHDFAESWNFMSQELQAQHDAELVEYEKERGESFVAFVKRKEMRTTMELERLDVTARPNGTWTVEATGKAKTWPLNAVGEAAGFTETEWEASLTLIAVERTELVPNGLLVAKRTLRFFDPRSEAAAHESSIAPSGVQP